MGFCTRWREVNKKYISLPGSLIKLNQLYKVMYYTIVLTKALTEGAIEVNISFQQNQYIRCNFDTSYFHAAGFLASGSFR